MTPLQLPRIGRCTLNTAFKPVYQLFSTHQRLGTTDQGGFSSIYQDKFVEAGEAGTCRRRGQLHMSCIFRPLVCALP